MSVKEFDLVVIGSGPGGYVAGIRAAQMGMKVAVAEKESLGGVCLNWGCIPTKALLKSAEVMEALSKGEEYGVLAEAVRPDFKKIIKRSRSVAGRMSQGVAYLMKSNKITVLKGRAELTGPHEATLFDGEGNEKDKLSAPHILLCTGGRPRQIPGVSFDGSRIISSKEAMSLDARPESMIIIGGGAIGVEFAYFYKALGTEVTVVEMLPHLLPIEDEEICRILERSFKKMKIKVMTGARVTSVDPSGEEVKVSLIDAKGRDVAMGAEKVLVAIGIQGNVENLGLDRLGIAHEKSFIQVDSSYRTSAKGVYAFGDVIGPPLLAHVASHEGMICVERIAGKEVPDLDYDAIPGCTYCQPQVASIGPSEALAKEKYEKVRVGRFPFRGLGKAQAIGHPDGLVKLIFDDKGGKLLGAHLVGHDATELLGELILARCVGATRSDLGDTMHAHPTLTEGIMEAAREAAGEAIHL